jgi:hypothetical protein
VGNDAGREEDLRLHEEVSRRSSLGVAQSPKSLPAGQERFYYILGRKETLNEAPAAALPVSNYGRGGGWASPYMRQEGAESVPTLGYASQAHLYTASTEHLAKTQVLLGIELFGPYG